MGQMKENTFYPKEGDKVRLKVPCGDIDMNGTVIRYDPNSVWSRVKGGSGQEYECYTKDILPIAPVKVKRWFDRPIRFLRALFGPCIGKYGD